MRAGKEVQKISIIWLSFIFIRAGGLNIVTIRREVIISDRIISINIIK